MSLKALFDLAAACVSSGEAGALDNDQKLGFYGLFSQVMKGPCTTKKPWFDFVGGAKWEAWHRLGSMSANDAMQTYIDTLATLNPAWAQRVLAADDSKRSNTEAASAKSRQDEDEDEDEDDEDESGSSDDSPSSDEEDSKASKKPAGPAVSTMTQEAIPDNQKTIYDWCRDGNVDKVKQLLQTTNVNAPDENGLTLLHWAADSGSVAMVKLLLAQPSVDVNKQDREGHDALYYATVCDQAGVLELLRPLSKSE